MSSKKEKEKEKNNRAEIKTALFVNERFLLDGSRIQGNSEKLIYRKRFPNTEHCAVGNNGPPTIPIYRGGLPDNNLSQFQ